MGRKATITYEQVAAAIDALRAEGASPTVDRVWEAVGKRGSRGTVHKLVKRRRGELDETLKEPSSLRQLPPDLQAAVLSFADQSAATARTRIADELREAMQETANLADENERLSEELDGLREQLTQVRADLGATEGRAGQLTLELETARKAIAGERFAAEAARISMAKAELRLEALEETQSELRRTRDELELEKNARREAERNAAVLAAQSEMHAERARELRGSLANAQVTSNQLDLRKTGRGDKSPQGSKMSSASKKKVKGSALNTDKQRQLGLDGDGTVSKQI